MSDIALYQDAAGGFDLLVYDDDFGIDWSLSSNIIVALFSDALVDADELRAGETDRRGFWADTFETGTNTGSRMWLLTGKNTQDENNNAVSYANEALDWLVPDYAESFTTTSQVVSGRREITIEVVNPVSPVREDDINETARRIISDQAALEVLDRDDSVILTFSW